MQTEKLISLASFCVIHNIEISFISLLQANGLVEIISISNTDFVKVNQIRELEKIHRFYHELDINIEGIEAINHLLERQIALQNEIISLRNRLRLYETLE
ncbi:MAG: MerR family transcriptional regulator [Bacteroidetes bacterium]|nr:MerR family transcriptional regulator [Bacteroidota bacterium]